NSATICNGQSANLTASGAASYTWSTGPTTASISVSPTTTTVYNVTGANGNCIDAKSSTVTVNALPSLTLASSSGTACTSATGGVNLTLTGSPAGGVYSGPGVVGSTFTTQASAGTYTAAYSYTNVATGCMNTTNTSIIVSVCTGINVMNLLDGQILVYPNPNNGVFMLQANFEDAFDVTIYNNIGQMVKNGKGLKGNNQIDLSGFATGIYNIVVNVNGNTKTIKMVIE
ncbi:MAG TPA: T9SS type A sorting domain-containing protein, partial [Bacteroidia bacterium]|nr:T9SS type A sorting domain-containing protein [Bacteroidia bacterium]